MTVTTWGIFQLVALKEITEVDKTPSNSLVEVNSINTSLKGSVVKLISNEPESPDSLVKLSKTFTIISTTSLSSVITSTDLSAAPVKEASELELTEPVIVEVWFSSKIKSSTTCRFIVCGIFQLVELKVTVGLTIVASVESFPEKLIITSEEGMAVKETVNVTRSPSASSFRFPLTSLMVKSPKSSSIVKTCLSSGGSDKNAGSEAAFILAVIDVFWSPSIKKSSTLLIIIVCETFQLEFVNVKLVSLKVFSVESLFIISTKTSFTGWAVKTIENSAVAGSFSVTKAGSTIPLFPVEIVVDSESVGGSTPPSPVVTSSSTVLITCETSHPGISLLKIVTL